MTEIKMQKTLKFEAVNNYGRLEFKPINNAAVAITKLSRNKHLTRSDLEVLALQGSTIRICESSLQRHEALVVKDALRRHKKPSS